MKNNNYENISKNIRKNILHTAMMAGSSSAHIGGALSLAEIISVLFEDKIKKSKTKEIKKLILSKGHACLVLYSALKQFKFLTQKELNSFEKNGSILLGHPVRNIPKGIEYSSGSLGMGLSYSAGLSHGYNLNDISHELFVILGDGECNEGSVWEAAMTISHHKLKNISVILDVNGFQQTGKTKEILNLINLKKKWKSFGWETLSINGHDFKQIKKAINKKTELPKVIIAKTKKGAGVKEFENNNTWHHNILTKSKYQQIIKKIN
jgi:transketolase